MSPDFTKRPSSWRNRFSRRIFSEYGSRAMPGNPPASSRRRLDIGMVRPPTGRVVRVWKVSRIGIEEIPRKSDRTTRVLDVLDAGQCALFRAKQAFQPARDA